MGRMRGVTHGFHLRNPVGVSGNQYKPLQYCTSCDDCLLHYRAAKANSSSSDIQGSPFALLSSIRIKQLNFDLLKLFISLLPRH